MMMEAIDWTPIYEQYKDQWVALADDRITVLGFGDEPEDALEMAAEKGSENPILRKVPKKIMPMIGHGIQVSF